MTDRILTASEAADVLNISLPTLYKLIEEDDLPAFRVGTHWRIPERQLRNWVDASSRPSEYPQPLPSSNGST